MDLHSKDRLNKVDRIVGYLDSVNDWIGHGTSYILLVMLVTLVYEVIVRYLFGSPTIWSLEINEYLLCVYSMLGGGYALLKRSHVNVEIVYSKLSLRKKSIINCINSLFFFSFCGALLCVSMKMAHDSWISREVSSSLLAAPLFPVKLMIPVGTFLLLFQGVLNFVRDLMTAVTGADFGRAEGGLFERKTKP